MKRLARTLQMKPSEGNSMREADAMNCRAVKWAYQQDGLNVTQKAVLISYAVHADAKGYSWPGVELIASTWGMDRRTVRRQSTLCSVSSKLRPTKKTRGWTGQVKVYRMPKIT